MKLDTSIVDLHRVPRRALTVLGIDGLAWRVVDGERGGIPLGVGEEIRAGETIVLSSGAEVVLETMVLGGGGRGRAHVFVPEDAFKTSPAKSDVPRLLEQLEQLERQVKQHHGVDPLAEQSGPLTPFERALSSEFAIQNLSLAAAQMLPEEVARAEQTVVLFFHGDAACVAMPRMSVPRIRAVMAALDRPVNPHLVDEETIHVLLESVYGGSALPPGGRQ